MGVKVGVVRSVVGESLIRAIAGVAEEGPEGLSSHGRKSVCTRPEELYWYKDHEPSGLIWDFSMP